MTGSSFHDTATDLHAHARNAAAELAYPSPSGFGRETDCLWGSGPKIRPVAPHQPGIDMSWTTGAACADGNPDDWFPNEYTRANEDARLTCLTCPCVDPCRQHGLDHERYGIWGGLTPQDRQRVRNGADVQVVVNRRHKIAAPTERLRQPIRHGTETGYKQHRMRGVPMCALCREAKNLAGRTQRAARNTEVGR